MASNNFLSINKDFWSGFTEPDTDKLLLVETSYHPAMNHANAVMAKILAQAKNLRIAWIKHKNTDEELLRSYSPNSLFIRFKEFPFLMRIKFLLRSFYYYLAYVLLKNRTLSFTYKGIPYGDFVYDGYLATYSMATLHRLDPRIIRIFYVVINHHEQAISLLKEHNIKAVLVIHYIGLDSGPLSRVAMQQKVPVYWKGGGHEIINFAVFRGLDQIYDYPLKPSAREIDFITAQYGEKIEEDFSDLVHNSDKYFYNPFTVAYQGNIYSSFSRGEFLTKMGLADQPIIFVMLHAFNDHPHSHFNSMLFNDYYDWFLKTLHFACKDTGKNWIFKEHPASRFYLARDIDLRKIMRNLPPHIKFVPSDSEINAAVVLNVASAIITCVGTAGVEMPALRGIPAIVAGETFYDRLGFTVEANTQEEYFSIIAAKEFMPLSYHQQLRAKCSYLYLNKYCMVPFAAGPAMTLEEMQLASSESKDSFFTRIVRLYQEKEALIYRQCREYANEISKADFRKLIRLPTNTKELLWQIASR